MPLSRRAFLGSSVSTLALTAAAPVRTWAQTPPADDTGGDWPLFRGGPGRTAATAEAGPRGNLAPIWLFKSDAVNPSNPIVTTESLFVLGSDDILWSLDRETGAQRWAISLGSVYSGGYHTVPAFDNGALFTGSATGILFALDPNTGAEKWRFATGDVIISPPLAVDGVVFAGSNDGFVYAVAQATGKQIWKTNTGPIFAGAASYADGRLFIGANDGTFFCLDAATGAIKWTFSTTRRIKTAAVNGGIVFAPSGDGRLYALDAETGAQRWASPDIGTFEVNNPSVLGPTVVSTIEQQNVSAYDVESGRQLWERTDLAGGFSSPVIAADVVYVSVLDKDLATLDLATGQTLATYELGRFAGAPAVVGGVLYIVADDGAAYAFGPAPDGAATPVPLPPPVIGTMPTSAPLSELPAPGVPIVGSFVRAISTASGPSDVLKGPEGIAFGPDGRMYLIDAINDRIVSYDNEGTFLTTIGKGGKSAGEFAFHSEDGLAYWGDITIGPDASLYVTDPFNARIQQLDADGKPLQSFGPEGDFAPSGIGFEATAGRIYVSDFATNTVIAFDPDGTDHGPLGPSGTPAFFAVPLGIAVEGDDTVLVCENDDSLVTRSDLDGTKIATIGRYGIADGRFRQTVDVVRDAQGRIYVTDYFGGRVQVFDADGTVIGVIGGPGKGDGQFSNPTYLAFGPDGLLYVSDDTAHRVLVFSVALPS
jgi:outer membrane protein assembly factor BamB